MSDQDRKPASPAKQTMTLAELVNMFLKTAGDERQPPPVRSFAAKLVLLTRFVRGALQRLAEVAVQQDALELKVAELDGSVAELAELVAGLAQRAPGEAGDAADAADAQAPADAAQDEDALAAKMVAEALAEVQADAAATEATTASGAEAQVDAATPHPPAPRPPAPRSRNGGARRGA